MEQYEYSNLINDRYSVKQGKYYNMVHQKHENTYGMQGADNIRDNIVSTFAEAMKQVNNSEKNNNMLLVGKVQSGKTSNLELFTALALDNGYNCVVIYGGYDSILLNQTLDRFKKTFDVPNEFSYDDSTPVVISTDDGKIQSFDDDIVKDLLALNRPIFIISMKRQNALSKVNALFQRIDKTNLNAFVIDDEGDQASLNTKKNKTEEASATYAEIVAMKDLLSDPLYLSVTATPHANIFLDTISRLRPNSIRLIEPGNGYCGAEFYHLSDSDAIEFVSEEDQNDLTNGVMPASLKSAIYHYFIASAIMKMNGISTSEMIIHSHRNVSNHEAIYNCVNVYIQDFKDDISSMNDESLKVRLKELENCFSHLFSGKIQNNYVFDDEFIKKLYEIVSKTSIILKNSVGRITQGTESFRKHKIYIGGDLLQRGVTFSHLVTTYFLRWANDGGNMDTNLQRARWFGYRNKYIDLCKIFTTESIAREFTTLSEVEADLWEQFFAVQNNEMKIDELLIRADNTHQRPTRVNVVNVQTISFRSKWIKQRVGLFDKIQIEENNTIVEKVKSSLSLNSTSIGRKDDLETAKFSIVSKNVLTDLINQIQSIFDMEPFERQALNELISDSTDIPVVFMNGCENEGRKRSFYQNNKIYALHQGADNKDKEKINYYGDSYVVIDKTKVNIQIHKIIPKKRTELGSFDEKEYTQYMFAIYVPKEKTYFMRGV